MALIRSLTGVAKTMQVMSHSSLDSAEFEIYCCFLYFGGGTPIP